MEKKIEELEAKIKTLELTIQNLEAKVDDMKNGEFGTGIYLGGCSEADVEYITSKTVEKKAGE